MKPIVYLILMGVLLFSCKKTKDGNQSEDESQLNASQRGLIFDNATGCPDCAALNASYQDSVEHPTILGAPIQNPYLVSVIQQAYNNIYRAVGTVEPPPFPTTNKYVKFSPNTWEQLSRLEEEDIDLTDYPLDREVIFEGDYYPQDGKGPEDIPEFWAVVPVTYAFPVGIPYTIIDQMYIPNNWVWLEDEAMYLTNNIGDTAAVNAYLQKRIERINSRYPVPCSVDPCGFQCPGHLDPQCGGGGPPGPPPGPPCNTTLVNGNIMVQNELATDKGYRGVRNARVVIRRTLKVNRVFTDNNGHFTATQYFNNNYRVLVKFKNQFARIARIRGIRLWEQFFPIKKNFGKRTSVNCNEQFLIEHQNVTGIIATSHWAAAVTHNGIQEHREMCQTEGVGLPPQTLHILLAQGKSGNAGNTYMYNAINKSGGITPGTLLEGTALYFFPSGGPVIAALIEIWQKRAPDIAFGYGGNFTSFYSTDQYCEVVYHELSHATHYNKVGNLWWSAFGLAELFNPQNGAGVYGPCCTNDAPRIAVGEAWAYHMGHYLADKKWGLQCTTFPEQGSDNKNFTNTLLFMNGGGYSSQHNFLEKFNPNRNNSLDPNAWIPKGLMNDLMDGGIEDPQSTIDIYDNVSGYTNAQFFNALTTDVGGMFSYRDKLLQQNNNNQASAVNILFQRYGY